MGPWRVRAETNRENAQHSTGPTSAAGKAKVALNPIVHGMYAKGKVLPGEHQESFDALLAALLEEFAPASAFHGLTVKELADELWLLQRGRAAEARHWVKIDALAANSELEAAAREAQIAAEEKLLDRLQQRIKAVQRHIDRLYKRLRVMKSDAQAEAAQAASHSGSEQEPARMVKDERGNKIPAQNTFDTVNWREIMQELYWGVSAGPQKGHPLPETYYCAYAIWYKQRMMVADDIGDDEAGSRLAAYEVAMMMREEGIVPKPGTVWGPADKLAEWRATAKTNDPFEAWFALVQRDYARRDGTTVEEAAAALKKLGPGYTIDDVAGPWHNSGDMAQKDVAERLAEER